MNIAVLMTCHNRRDVTLACVNALLPQLTDRAGLYVVDDGSSDGTSSAIQGLGDCRVHLLKGDGTLYWAKGMRTAWDAAISNGQDWDGYLWLNDDAELKPDAVAKMLTVDDGERIVVGELENAKGEIVYGTRPDGLFTGNCVFVPRKAYERLGVICGDYSHAWADSDYAMKAKRMGIGVESAGVVGKAEGHSNRPRLKGLSLKERMALLWHPKGWNVHDLWLYRRRNWGWVSAMFSCLHMVAHVVIGER